MARDMQKTRVSNDRYDEKTYDAVGVSISKLEPLHDGIEKIKQEKIPVATYIRKSVEEKIQRDGL